MNEGESGAQAKPGWFAHQAAFGLPEGTIRAGLAVLVIGADIFMQCYYKWAPPTLDTMAAMAFAWYFGASVARKP